MAQKMRLLVFALGTLGMVATAAYSAPPANATFYKDVLPVLQSRCQECHRPGEVAPFPLMTYEQARPWAKAIKQALVTQKMPPWDVDNAHSAKFANDRSLSQPELDTLVSWVDAGAPAGDPKDAPPAREFVEGWTIGKPDVVLDMGNDFVVPAAGTVEYQYIVVPGNFTEDKWISAIEVRPTSPSVMHHIVLHSVPRLEGSRYAALKPYVAYNESVVLQGGQPQARERGPESDRSNITYDPNQDEWIAEYFPGAKGWVALPGYARFLKAGTTFVIQAHYTATGKVTADRIKIGLVFAKEAPKMRAFGIALNNNSLRIPPGDPYHALDTNVIIPNDVTITGLQPHMHLRGRAFEVDVTYPDGRKETLIDIPRFDFNWQMNHWLAEPRLLPKGTKLHMTSVWDNSAGNKYNPDPTKEIFWGEQSWEEMITGFFDMAIPVSTDPATVFPRPQRPPQASQAQNAAPAVAQ